MKVHETHKTRFSDASTYDEICEFCGATDSAGSTRLGKPCPKVQVAPPDPPKKANDTQIAGNHYRRGAAATGDQHWDRQWRLHGRGYFIGQITRYVERFHLKNGLEDLDKASHYIQKLKELEQAWADGTGPPPGETGAAPLPGMKYTRVETKPEPVTCSPEVMARVREPRVTHDSHVWKWDGHRSMVCKACDVCGLLEDNPSALLPCARIPQAPKPITDPLTDACNTWKEDRK